MHAELLLGAFPEAVRTWLSSIKRRDYDQVAKIGLASNDRKDHRHGLITYKDHIYIPPNP